MEAGELRIAIKGEKADEDQRKSQAAATRRQRDEDEATKRESDFSAGAATSEVNRVF